jgi:hypothetical protein
VPLSSFSEFNKEAGGDIWFALDESRPLAVFAGMWTTWTSVREVKEGETTNDLYGLRLFTIVPYARGAISYAGDGGSLDAEPMVLFLFAYLALVVVSVLVASVLIGKLALAIFERTELNLTTSNDGLDRQATALVRLQSSRITQIIVIIVACLVLVTTAAAAAGYIIYFCSIASAV